jgi:hypothetical protein
MSFVSLMKRVPRRADGKPNTKSVEWDDVMEHLKRRGASVTAEQRRKEAAELFEETRQELLALLNDMEDSLR